MQFDHNHRWIFDQSLIRHQVYKDVLTELARVIVGYEWELLQICLLFPAGGNAIMMTDSGLGKTLIASCLPKVIGGLSPARLDGTPDAMPSSITGYFVESEDGTQKYRDGQVPKGTNLLHLDEGTRYGGRCWAAFMRILEEKAKTVEGHTVEMGEIFTGLVTANFPEPGEGTVDLPRAAYDRFMLLLNWGYPPLERGKELIRRAWRLRAPKAEQILEEKTTVEVFLKIRAEIREIAKAVAEDVVDYTARLQYTTNPHFDLIDKLGMARNNKPYKKLVVKGGSPRMGMDLVIAAAALAHALGAEKVRPHHVKAMFPSVAAAHTKMNAMAATGRIPVTIDDFNTAVLGHVRV